MTPALLPLVVVFALGSAQDVLRTEAPGGRSLPVALASWAWPDCARVLAAETNTFAEAMCRAAAARTRFHAATDIVDTDAARYRSEILSQLRRAAGLATSTIERRAAFTELAVTYSAAPAEAAQADFAWREVIALEPDKPAAYLALARTQGERGALDAQEATLNGARQALPRNREIVEALARFYRTAGRVDDAVRAVREYAEQDPADAKRQWLLATWYWQLQSAPALAARAPEFTAAGLKAIDQALLLQPDDPDALNCKYVLLRRQAELAPDAASRAAALASARQVRDRLLTRPKR